MVRRKFIAGNWKMNTTRNEATALAVTIVMAIGKAAKVDVALCPPFVYLDTVREMIACSQHDRRLN